MQLLDPRRHHAPPSDSPRTKGDSFPDSFPEDRRRALRDREPEALAAFYDGYFDRLYGYIRRMVGQEHLAEDLTQEVFMHILSNLESYDPQRPLRPWVFTIATNKVRDYWRSRRHRSAQREVSLELDPTGGWSPSTDLRPEESLVASERSEGIAAAIEALPESMRLTLVLRYYEGLSFAAIAEIVERNEAAVRKRYSRALEELRRSLGPGGQGGPDGRARGERP
jgi:RNA polymerase sigma-70 factor (ECF subfamily)